MMTVNPCTHKQMMSLRIAFSTHSGRVNLLPVRLPSRFPNHLLRPHANSTLLTHTIVGYSVYRIGRSPTLRLVRMTPAPATSFIASLAAIPQCHHISKEGNPAAIWSSRKWHINGPIPTLCLPNQHQKHLRNPYSAY